METDFRTAVNERIAERKSEEKPNRRQRRRRMVTMRADGGKLTNSPLLLAIAKRRKQAKQAKASRKTNRAGH